MLQQIRNRESGQRSQLEGEIPRLRRVLDTADAIVIGAGAGLSASAGFTYSGERFRRYFADFEARYGFHDMYTGGFWPYKSPEEYWAYWSRYIYVNRFMDPPKPVYEKLYDLVRDREYFVITTNVDHCFQKAGFAKERLFYTQGDYGLFQCSGPCCAKTYDNKPIIRAMLTAQGFTFDAAGRLSRVIPRAAASAARTPKRIREGEFSDGLRELVRQHQFEMDDRPSGLSSNLSPPAPPQEDAVSRPGGEPAAGERGPVRMRIPSYLVPRCPVCGRPMTMNLRSDDTFVEDEGWQEAAARYQSFLREWTDTGTAGVLPFSGAARGRTSRAVRTEAGRRGKKVLYLELGVGYNTPVIIKYPFQQLTAHSKDAVYACVNRGEAHCPQEISRRSICIDGDIGEVLGAL